MVLNPYIIIVIITLQIKYAVSHKPLVNIVPHYSHDSAPILEKLTEHEKEISNLRSEIEKNNMAQSNLISESQNKHEMELEELNDVEDSFNSYAKKAKMEGLENELEEELIQHMKDSEDKALKTEKLGDAMEKKAKAKLLNEETADHSIEKKKFSRDLKNIENLEQSWLHDEENDDEQSVDENCQETIDGAKKKITEIQDSVENWNPDFSEEIDDLNSLSNDPEASKTALDSAGNNEEYKVLGLTPHACACLEETTDLCDKTEEANHKAESNCSKLIDDMKSQDKDDSTKEYKIIKHTPSLGAPRIVRRHVPATSNSKVQF